MLFATVTDVTIKKELDPFSHVRDAYEFHVFDSLHIHLPYPVSKFLIIILLSGLIVAALMIWLARKAQSGEPPRGRLWNLAEGALFFIRDKIARPAIGEHDANRYVPFLASLFLFIFLMNLFGLIPFMGSPTAHIYVTGALAIVSFAVTHAGGVAAHGAAGYLKTFVPPIHLEGGARYMAPFLIVGMAALEYVTAFIRVVVLAVRLFANMLAGHMALFIILFFIKMVSDPAYQIDIAKGHDWLYWPVSLFSVVLVLGLSLLEVFIAGLQAFIFTFLTAIYIGLAKHPPH
ncbi:MAG TPA: F0F1 ATP synthase subunit A [Fimbriiglobus sp.]|nr:F0F1 ATP synthase subunit A [Fimbriiglobus sp.]